VITDDDIYLEVIDKGMKFVCLCLLPTQASSNMIMSCILLVIYAFFFPVIAYVCIYEWSETQLNFYKDRNQVVIKYIKFLYHEAELQMFLIYHKPPNFMTQFTIVWL